jgi:glycosyltransferase involved in cell wall biosynthesis
MSKSKSPAISIILPVYNASKYLPTAIESVLNQTFSNFELIIIDDGSTDSSGKIIRKYALQDKRIKAKKNYRNQGICRTLNYGLSMVKGEYIARMDADDWSYPDRLKLQYRFMKCHPETVVCGSAIDICNEKLDIKNQRFYPISDKKVREKIFRINPFAHPAVMFKKQAVIDAGGYNEKLSGVEDYDLYFRIGKLGKFANLSETLLKLRTHSDSISGSTIERQARQNLYVRVKAISEYGYVASISDKIYFCVNLIAVWLIPDFLQFGFYNFLRKYWQ